jgi:uncharacterized membrane protein
MSVGRLRAAIALLSLLGAGIAAYLVYTRYSGTSIFCATGGCETVQQSRYAVVAGVPVAALGLIGYAAILVTAAVPKPASAALGVAFATIGVVFSAYLLYAQIALVDAICQWCVANDAVICLVATACIWRYLREQTAEGAAKARPLRRAQAGEPPVT